MLRKLAVLEVAEQTQDLGVEPDQGHCETKGNAPCHLGRCTFADEAVSCIKVREEAERCQADAEEREDDRDDSAVTQWACATGEQCPYNVAQDKNQDANHHASEDAVELRSDLDSAGLVYKQHADEYTDGAKDCLANEATCVGVTNSEAGQQKGDSADEEAFEYCVNQSDCRRSVLLAEGADQNGDETTDRTNKGQDHAEAWANQPHAKGDQCKNDNNRESDTSLGDHIIHSHWALRLLWSYVLLVDTTEVVVTTVWVLALWTLSFLKGTKNGIAASHGVPDPFS